MRSELLKPAPAPPPEDITIGQEAIDRASYSLPDRTFIANVPADGTGKITEIQLYVFIRLMNIDVATFEKVGLDKFTTRAFQVIPTQDPGYQTVPVDLDVVEGDFLAIYFQYGQIEWSPTGYEGVWHRGENWIPCTEKTFPFYSGSAISLHGTGKTS